jgi:hypothetical protein
MDDIWYMFLVPGLPVAVFVGWIYWFVSRRDRNSRRPFHEMPRPAGWSLQNRMTDLLGDFLIQYMIAGLIGVVAWALAISGKVNPWLALGLGFMGCSWFLWNASRRLVRYGNHRVGLHGEQVVGRILDHLSSDIVRVFHDLEIQEPGKKPWNIDHVVVTSASVFAIETKTRRKPRGNSDNGKEGHRVVFDGDRLIFPLPLKPSRHGLDQAERNASWLARKLSELNGEAVPVIPVLVLPGWWVEAKGRGTVAVMNPKQLDGFISKRSAVLQPARFRAIAAQLDERCRINLSEPA